MTASVSASNDLRKGVFLDHHPSPLPFFSFSLFSSWKFTAKLLASRVKCDYWRVKPQNWSLWWWGGHFFTSTVGMLVCIHPWVSVNIQTWLSGTDVTQRSERGTLIFHVIHLDASCPSIEGSYHLTFPVRVRRQNVAWISLCNHGKKGERGKLWEYYSE